jgi:hypothetical protein
MRAAGGLQRTIAMAVLATWIAVVMTQKDSAAKVGIIMRDLVTPAVTQM